MHTEIHISYVSTPLSLVISSSYISCDLQHSLHSSAFEKVHLSSFDLLDLVSLPPLAESQSAVAGFCAARALWIFFGLMRVSEATSTMSSTEESDELTMSSHAGHAVHDLLNDLHVPSHSNHSNQLSPSLAQLPTWAFPMTSSSRNSPSPAVADTLAAGANFRQRSTRRSAPTAVVVVESDPNTSTQQPSIFNTPNRSIFATGPPTSSLSVNTAQASMSAPSPANTGHPFSALAAPSSSAPRRAVHYQTDGTAPVRRSRASRAEKDVDNPSSEAERTTSAERRTTSTPVALTRLFSSAETSKPTVSGHPSFTRGTGAVTYTRGIISFP